MELENSSQKTFKFHTPLNFDLGIKKAINKEVTDLKNVRKATLRNRKMTDQQLKEEYKFLPSRVAAVDELYGKPVHQLLGKSLSFEQNGQDNNQVNESSGQGGVGNRLRK